MLLLSKDPKDTLLTMCVFDEDFVEEMIIVETVSIWWGWGGADKNQQPVKPKDCGPKCLVLLLVGVCLQV